MTTDANIKLKVMKSERLSPMKHSDHHNNDLQQKLAMVDFEQEWKIEQQINKMRDSFNKRLVNHSSYV